MHEVKLRRFYFCVSGGAEVLAKYTFWTFPLRKVEERSIKGQGIIEILKSFVIVGKNFNWLIWLIDWVGSECNAWVIGFSAEHFKVYEGTTMMIHPTLFLFITKKYDSCLILIKTVARFSFATTNVSN